jgi:2-hydroxy-3-oxopropionate reductase
MSRGMNDTIAPPAHVAFAGLGTMGHAMARNLLRAGFRVTVTTRTRAKADELLAEGATWADTAAEAAHGCAAFALCVPDAPDVAAVLFGPDGALAQPASGLVVLDFSTIARDAAMAHARRAAEAGAALLDCPVSGGPQGAADATLTVFVGGDAAALTRAQPVLRAVGRTITHLGPAGAGQTGKAANQLITSGTIHLVAEALAMAAKAGLDPEALRTALLGGSARSAALENHARRIIAQAWTPAAFRAELMLKDVRAVLAAAAAVGAWTPTAERAERTLAALVDQGGGAEDTVAIARLIAARS